MRKCLLLDNGLGFECAREIAKSGWEVFYSLPNLGVYPSMGEWLLGRGFDKEGVHRVEWTDVVDDVSMVVVPDAGMGKLADWLRDKGYIVFGGSLEGDELDSDRFFNKKVMKKSGMNVPESYTFDTPQSAYSFLKNSSKLWNIRVSRHGRTETLTSNSILQALSHVKNIMKKSTEDVELALEERVEGINISASCFVSNGRILRPIFVNFAHNSGGAGVWVDDHITLDQGLERCGEYLGSINYTGAVEIDGVIVGKKFFGFGIHPKMSFPMSRLYNSMVGNFGETIFRVANNRVRSIPVKKNTYASYVSVYENPEQEEQDDFVIIGRLSDENRVSFECPIKDASGLVWSVPGASRVCQVRGYGKDFTGAFSNCEEKLISLRGLDRTFNWNFDVHDDVVSRWSKLKL